MQLLPGRVDHTDGAQPDGHPLTELELFLGEQLLLAAW